MDDPKVVEGIVEAAPRDPKVLLEKVSYPLKTFIALTSKSVPVAKAYEALKDSIGITFDEAVDVAEFLEPRGDPYICYVFGVKPNELRCAIDTLVDDYKDLLEPPLVHPKQSTALVLTQMSELQLKEPVEIEEVTTAILNRIKHTLRSAVSPEDIALLSRSMKDLASAGLCNKDDDSELGELIDDEA